MQYACEAPRDGPLRRNYKNLQDGAIQIPQSASNVSHLFKPFQSIHDDEARDKHRVRTEVMMRTNPEGVANAASAHRVKVRIARMCSAVGLATILLSLGGCAYESPPQPRLPYRGNESTNPAYRSADPNCGPPPYAPGSACSPYAAPSAPVPNTDAYGRPYPPTDAYGRPYPTDAQGRPYPPPPPPPAYRETKPADGAAAPENGSATAH